MTRSCRSLASRLSLSMALLLAVLVAPGADAQPDEKALDRIVAQATDAGASASDAVALARAVVTAHPPIRTARIGASDASARDHFGGAVSLSGHRALVGAAQIGCAAGEFCGAAYVFELEGGVWVETAILTASDVAAGHHFGGSVSLSGDRALVGASGRACGAGDACGAAYVFELEGGVWTETAILTLGGGAADGDLFGNSVSLTDGPLGLALVGAPGRDCTPTGFDCGLAVVFEGAGAFWDRLATLEPSDAVEGDRFGAAVSLSDNRALIGVTARTCGPTDSNCGVAYIFEGAGIDWVETERLVASDASEGDRFGWSVAISGNRALIGAVFRDCSAGETCGAAYVFEDSGTGWAETATLVASDGASFDTFGDFVSLSGDRALVGATGRACTPADESCGAAYLFEASGGGWTETATLVSGDVGPNFFGLPVSLSGARALVGSQFSDCAAGENCGAAYVFEAPLLAAGNDIPAAAAPLFSGQSVYAGSTVDAALDGTGTSASCLSGGPANDADRVVWWRLLATDAGPLTLDLGGSDFDTILSVLRRDGTEVACNDDAASGTLTSALTFDAVAETLYFVRVSGYDGASAQGQVALRLEGPGVVTGPPDDDLDLGRGLPLLLPLGRAVQDTNVGATVQNGEPVPACAPLDGANSVWRYFEAPGQGRATLDLAGSSFETVLAVYSVFDGAFIEVACDYDSGGGTPSEATFPVESGRTYFVRVSGFGEVEGPIVLAYDFESTVAAEDDVPATTALAPPLPNPTSGVVRLGARLADAGAIRVEVFDALGRRVAVVADGRMVAGHAAWTWSAEGHPAGLYVVRLTAGGEVHTQAVTVAR